jgi:hypothetical protein
MMKPDKKTKRTAHCASRTNFFRGDQPTVLRRNKLFLEEAAASDPASYKCKLT